MIPILILLILLVALFYWEVWVCEGAHLGKGFVAWTYDLAANRYEKIKDFDWDWEKRFIGEPLARTIGSLEAPRILDLGAGTGRIARSLQLALSQGENLRDSDEITRPQQRGTLASPQIPESSYLGTVEATAGAFTTQPELLVCAEPSKRMVALGVAKTPIWAYWVRAWAVPLPFPEASFDLITCLEVLEFTPDPGETLEEIWRTLRPGGWLMLSNRRGIEARLMIGKTMKKEELKDTLKSMGFHSVLFYPWQVDYDLVWARKNWEVS
jgi:ubiquinone/menaquinone biosynthesis C-methylase UbiE